MPQKLVYFLLLLLLPTTHDLISILSLTTKSAVRAQITQQ
jgi:hypothetical protein